MRFTYSESGTFELESSWFLVIRQLEYIRQELKVIDAACEETHGVQDEREDLHSLTTDGAPSGFECEDTIV